jgi:hypothetical protein
VDFATGPWFDVHLVSRLAFAITVFSSGLAAAQPPTTEPPPADPAAPPAGPTPIPPPAPEAGKVPDAPPPISAPAPTSPTESLAVEREVPAESPWTMRLGGYLQSQLRTRANSPAPFDEDGFRLARVRLTMSAEGKVAAFKLSAFVEAELAPSFILADAYATITRPFEKQGYIALDVGQTRVPISRQQLLSDSRLSFVDKAQIASIAPDRDLGARVTFAPPWVKEVRVTAGAFNGETRNQVQNINEGYLYAGRIEVTPIGSPVPLAESAFDHDYVAIGFSVGHNKLTPGDYHEKRLIFGADVAGAYKGLSGSFEYLETRYRFEGDVMKLPGPNYKANGFVAQAAYLLPVVLPLRGARIEVGARLEEVDRNDTVPIPQLADPNQSVRQYTGVVSLYLKKHLLKAQVAASHFQEIEDQTSTGTNATYDNDQVLLQVTYRVE